MRNEKTIRTHSHPHMLVTISYHAPHYSIGDKLYLVNIHDGTVSTEAIRAIKVTITKEQYADTICHHLVETFSLARVSYIVSGFEFDEGHILSHLPHAYECRKSKYVFVSKPLAEKMSKKIKKAIKALR